MLIPLVPDKVTLPFEASAAGPAFDVYGTDVLATRILRASASLSLTSPAPPELSCSRNSPPP